MYIFVYLVFCDSTLESVVDKLNNVVIKERKIFLQFFFLFILIPEHSENQKL